MKKILYFLAFVGILSGIQACDSSTQKQEGSSKDSTAVQEDSVWQKNPVQTEDTRPLNVRLDGLKDSINVSWKNMTENDINKLKNVGLLLDNVKVIKNFKNFTLTAQINGLYQEVSKLRYDKMTMRDAKHMDTYDKKTEELVNSIKQLAETTPNINDYQTVADLINEIVAADQSDFFLRKSYQSFVKEYNEILTTKKAEVQKLGDKYANLKEEPDFNYGAM